MINACAKLDMLPFRRALANSTALYAAAYALQPALIHIFEHASDAEAYKRQPPAPGLNPSVVSTTGPSAGPSPFEPGTEPRALRPGVPSVSLPEFSRMVLGSGLLTEAAGLDLQPADVVAARRGEAAYHPKHGAGTPTTTEGLPAQRGRAQAASGKHARPWSASGGLALNFDAVENDLTSDEDA